MRLIDADELKERLEPKPQDCYSMDYDPSAPSYIAFNAVMNVIEDAPTVMEWIPVTETLPPADEWVLVTVENRTGRRWVQKAQYSHKYDNWADEHEYFYGVIAWMKMMEPYQEDER